MVIHAWLSVNTSFMQVSSLLVLHAGVVRAIVGEMVGHVKSLMLGGMDVDIATELGLFDLLDLGELDMEDAVTAMSAEDSASGNAEPRAPPTPQLTTALAVDEHETPVTPPPIPVPGSPVRPFTSSSLHPISSPTSPTILVSDGGASDPGAEEPLAGRSHQRTLVASSLGGLTELMKMMGNEAVATEVEEVLDLGVTDPESKHEPLTRQRPSREHSTDFTTSLDTVDGISVFLGSGIPISPQATVNKIVHEEFDGAPCSTLASLASAASQPSLDITSAINPDDPNKAKRKLVPRRDTPVLRTSTKGSFGLAMSSGTLARRAQTMKELEDDKVAPSGRQPRASRWRTWCRLHRNGSSEPVLPLTVESITLVLGQLKRW